MKGNDIYGGRSSMRGRHLYQGPTSLRENDIYGKAVTYELRQGGGQAPVAPLCDQHEDIYVIYGAAASE